MESARDLIVLGLAVATTLVYLIAAVHVRKDLVYSFSFVIGAMSTFVFVVGYGLALFRDLDLAVYAPSYFRVAQGFLFTTVIFQAGFALKLWSRDAEENYTKLRKTMQDAEEVGEKLSTLVDGH